MIALLSPAKSLREDFGFPEIESTQPAFLEQSERLSKTLKKMSAKKIGDLMKLSTNLAELNTQRFANWSLPFDMSNAFPAGFLFDGDVYKGLQIEDLNRRQLAYLQDHVLILSGLYGALRPLDLIQPYRLEMGTKLKVGRKENLYQFWGDTLGEMLIERLGSGGTLVNLASNEYAKAALTKKVKSELKVVSPQFLDAKGGDYKIISFYAKRARGLMARFMAQNELKKVADLRAFDLEGYTYNSRLSNEDEWIFTREKPINQ